MKHFCNDILPSASGLLISLEPLPASSTRKGFFLFFFPPNALGHLLSQNVTSSDRQTHRAQKGVSAMLKILLWTKQLTRLRWTLRKQTAPVLWIEKLLYWKYCYGPENRLYDSKKITGFTLNKNCWSREGKRAVRESLLSILHMGSRSQVSQRAKIWIFISMAPLVLKTNLQQSYFLLNSSGDLLWTDFTAIQVSNRVAIVSSSSSLT